MAQNTASYEISAPNTITVDFAYAETHPLRHGTILASKHSSMASESDFYDDPQYESYSTDEINSRAVALFDFTPENDNEVALREGQEIWVSYRHGQGWLVAEDPETGENGLVPEEYVHVLGQEEEEAEDVPQQYLPSILQSFSADKVAGGNEGKVGNERKSKAKTKGDTDDEWVDTDDENGSGVGLGSRTGGQVEIDGDSEGSPTEAPSKSKKIGEEQGSNVLPQISEASEENGANLHSLETKIGQLDVK